MKPSSELWQAIRDNDLPRCERLLADRPELAGIKDDDGNSPLLLSVYWNKPEFTACLLGAGVEVSFFEACAAGLLDRVERMLRERPELVRQTSHDGWTALHLAAFFGHREIARRLLEAGGELLIVSRNAEGALPIRSAAAGGRKDLVLLLIEHGCPPDARSSDNDYTALQVAVESGNAELAAALIAAGADPNLGRGEG